MRGRRTDLRGDAVAIATTALAIFGLIYVVGRVSTPTFGETAAEIMHSVAVRSGSAADLVGSGAAVLRDLRADRLSRGAPAVIDVSGAVEARFVLDQADAPTAWRPLQGERPDLGEGFPIDVDVRFATDNTTLRLLAGQAEAGVPQTDRMTVVLTTGGRSFVAGTGDCSLELGRSGLAPLIVPGIVEVVVPYFDGQILCADVADIRNGDTVSFAAVFGYDSHDH